MSRRTALAVLAGFALAVLLASVSTAGEVPFWHAPPPDTGSSFESTTQTPAAATVPPIAVAPLDDGGTAQLPEWLLSLLQILAFAIVVALVIIAPPAVWRRRPRLRWSRSSEDDDFDVLPQLARQMRADAADQRDALMRGAPRNAIVECWLRLEKVAANVGLVRHPADTSTEFTTRVLGASAVDPEAILALSELYREARFSTHEMDELARERAIASLEALHAALDAYQPESAAR